MSKKLTFKERVAEIRKLVFGDAAPADAAPADALQSYTTADGRTVKIDKLETGGHVFADDGTTPVTGDITLQDGTIVSADATGTITAVAAAAPPAGDPGQMAMSAAADFLKRMGIAFAEAETPATSIQALFAKFANGTPEDRIGNLETMCAALMQYSFGYKIEEAARRATEEAAINAFKSLAAPQVQQFTDQLAAEQQARQAQELKFTQTMDQMLQLVTAMAEEPAGDPVHPPADKDPAPSKKDRAQVILKAARHAAATR